MGVDVFLDACVVERREEGGRRYGCVVRVVCVVSLVCAVCDVGVWVCLCGEGGAGGVQKGGEGASGHVVLACPTCLQVVGVFTPSASWRLLSHVLCVSA